MVFSSIFFLLFFLPILIIFYYIVNPKYRNILLLIFSLLFYVTGEGKYSIVLIISILINYTFGILISKYNSKESKRPRLKRQGFYFSHLYFPPLRKLLACYSSQKILTFIPALKRAGFSVFLIN